MNNKKIHFSVGALMYTPALNEKTAATILNGQLGVNYSVAICLEDTIAASAIGYALDQIEQTFKELHIAAVSKGILLPKIFVRVRNPEQIHIVYQRIVDYIDIFFGFIFPKYSIVNADKYNDEFIKVISSSPNHFYMMPILESEDIVDYASRSQVLVELKKKIDSMEEYVLNVRVGGNDFGNAFGLRRHIDESIYDVLPVAQLLCDILTVFSRDYVVSAPVWEYYSSKNNEWSDGLRRELKYDVLNGFIGKTVIHPKQIPVVVDALKATQQDYEDAMEILSWDKEKELLVGGSSNKERMNEVNTHLRWAKRIAMLASIYGIQ